jgi:putative membrane protein
MILTEREKKLWALTQFLLAGILGLIVLQFPHLNQPLLPMLSGLFGISTVFLSLHHQVTIPHQQVHRPLGVTPFTVFRATALSVFSGGTVALLPGLGSAQAGILGNYLTGNLRDKGFLILIGGINTVNMIVSLLTFYTIEKARNGAIVVVKEIMRAITLNELFLFLAVGLTAGGIAGIIALMLSRWCAQRISTVNYRLIGIVIIGIVSSVVWLFSGFWGIVIMIISAAIGVLPAHTGVRKSHNLGCLLLPVMLWMLL